MTYETEKLISDLKELYEHINLIRNMFYNIEKYREPAINAKAKIDNILFELTGDKFYKREGEGKDEHN